jgi:hypothetical protein
MIVLLAGALTLATPAASAVATTAPAPPRVTTGVELAQVIIRERTREDLRPMWRSERRDWRDRRRWSRDWDGYTGQVCRTRTVYKIDRFGERVRRVVRTCN